MPEGDTVFRTARRLEAALGGRALSLSDFRVPAHATLSLVDWMIESVVSRGKHLLIRARPPARVSAPPLSIHSHLLMEGRWDVYATGERWRSPAFKARAVLGNPAFTAVGFELGFLQVLRTTDEVEVIGHLGPDPLGHSWDPAEAVRIIGERLQYSPDRRPHGMPRGAELTGQSVDGGMLSAQLLYRPLHHAGSGGVPRRGEAGKNIAAGTARRRCGAGGRPAAPDRLRHGSRPLQDWV